MSRGGLGLALLVCVSSCDPRVTRIGEQTNGPGQYLEAESGALTGGMLIVADSEASGGHWITPAVGAATDAPPGPARAVYELDAKVAGTYRVWGRVHGQDLDSNRCFFQIDGGDWLTWRISTGDEWFWDVLHDNFDYGVPYELELAAGPHQLALSSAVDQFGVDRLYYAPDHSEPQGTEPVCDPPHSVLLDGACNPSCGSLAGQCGGEPCVGLPTMPTYDCPACCIP
jgi:hypothetical protein